MKYIQIDSVVKRRRCMDVFLGLYRWQLPAGCRRYRVSRYFDGWGPLAKCMKSFRRLVVQVCGDYPALNRTQFRILQGQPLHAALPEIYFHFGVHAAAVAVHNDAGAELGVRDILADTEGLAIFGFGAG